MADYLNEDSFCSWHTCQEENQYTKPNNENIIKDINLNIDDSDADSIKEFQQIIDKTDAFNSFKNGNNSDNDFLRPTTPSNYLKRDNSTLLSNRLRPKYLSFNSEQLQQNISLADKTTPSNNIYINNVETSYEVPSISVNDEKVSNILNISDVKSNILSVNQTSSMTLIDPQDQNTDQINSNISMPGGTLSIFEETNAMLPPSGKSNQINKKENLKDTKNNLKDKKENIKDNIKDNVEKVKNDIEIFKDNKVDNIKNSMEDIKEKINGSTKDFKESSESVKMNDTEKNNKDNDVVDNNSNENTSTLGRLFNYFRGFGKSENNENDNDKENNNNNKNENENDAIQTVTNNQNLQVPSLKAESSSLTMVDDEDYDDSEFVNAFDGNYNESFYEKNYKNINENHDNENSFFNNNKKVNDKNNDENKIENENEFKFENAYQDVYTNISNQQNINISQAIAVEEPVVQHPNDKNSNVKNLDSTKTITNNIATNVNEDDINNKNNNKPLPTTTDNNILINNYYDNTSNNNINYDNKIIDENVNINNDNIVDNNKITDDRKNNTNKDNKNSNAIIIENNNTQNETIEDDESEATTEDFQDAITASYANISINNELQYSSQYISKIHPMALSEREGTVRIIKNPLVKKGSSNTLKAQPINIELVPVHKPINELGDYNNTFNTFDSFKTGIQESRIINEEYDNNILPNNHSNKILKKKHKKRKWYKKIFRFAICKRHNDV